MSSFSQKTSSKAVRLVGFHPGMQKIMSFLLYRRTRLRVNNAVHTTSCATSAEAPPIVKIQELKEHTLFPAVLTFANYIIVFLFYQLNNNRREALKKFAVFTYKLLSRPRCLRPVGDVSPISPGSATERDKRKGKPCIKKSQGVIVHVVVGAEPLARSQ
jgi:hypothetical protein